MRFTSGIIVGFILAVGAAYVIDALHSAPGPDGAASRHMVNWDVVSSNMRDLSTSAQDAWARLTGSAPKHEPSTKT